MIVWVIASSVALVLWIIMLTIAFSAPVPSRREERREREWALSLIEDEEDTP